MNISEFKQGKNFRLLSFGEASFIYRQRLMSMGLLEGLVIKVLNVAPLGCPIHLEVGQVHIALRRNEIQCLVWEEAG